VPSSRVTTLSGSRGGDRWTTSLSPAGSFQRSTLCGHELRKPGFGRPLQCDEYPFASTYQGSPMAAGRPDPRRISVCPIAPLDNTTAGNAENAFFMQQRIFDEVDHFAVTVTQVPTPAPTAAQALPCPTPTP